MKCNAKTGSGEPCKNNATEGSEYCHLHQPEPEPKGECGHVNRHAYGSDGELDPITCEKEEGHDGNHGAYRYEKIYGEPMHDPVTKVVSPSVQFEGERWVEWTDAAGTPVEEIQEEPIPRPDRVIAFE